ncbi:MAG: hypothetical protein AB1758_32895, partial [Candidatus Eremiobacterota bacterium]
MGPSTFLEHWVKATGGECEREGDRQVLLAGADCGLPELAEFWAGESRPPLGGPEPLFLGHPYLEGALRHARQVGATALRHCPTPVRSRPGLAQEAARAFGFRNGRLELGAPVPRTVPWAIFSFCVTFVWDEKREEHVTVGVDLLTGARVDPAALERVWLEPGGLAGTCRERLLEAYQRARGYLQASVEGRLGGLQAEADRYREVELSRAERYYTGILGDLARRSASAEKIARTEADRAIRRRDLEQKFTLRAAARLWAVEQVDVPRLVLPAVLRERQVQRPLELGYNVMTHSFDPLPCEGCGTSGHTFRLCSEGHLTCPGCSGCCHGCRRDHCAACGGGRLVEGVCPGCRSRELEVRAAASRTVSAQGQAASGHGLASPGARSAGQPSLGSAGGQASDARSSAGQRNLRQPGRRSTSRGSGPSRTGPAGLVPLRNKPSHRPRLPRLFRDFPYDLWDLLEPADKM